MSATSSLPSTQDRITTQLINNLKSVCQTIPFEDDDKKTAQQKKDEYQKIILEKATESLTTIKEILNEGLDAPTFDEQNKKVCKLQSQHIFVIGEMTVLKSQREEKSALARKYKGKIDEINTLASANLETLKQKVVDILNSKDGDQEENEGAAIKYSTNDPIVIAVAQAWAESTAQLSNQIIDNQLEIKKAHEEKAADQRRIDAEQANSLDSELSMHQFKNGSSKPVMYVITGLLVGIVGGAAIAKNLFSD